MHTQKVLHMDSRASSLAPAKFSDLKKREEQIKQFQAECFDKDDAEMLR